MMTIGNIIKYRTRANELNIREYLAKHAGDFVHHGKLFDVVARSVSVEPDSNYRFGQGQRRVTATIEYSLSPQDYLNSIAFRIDAPNYGTNDGETTLDLLVDSGPGFLRFYRTYTLKIISS